MTAWRSIAFHAALWPLGLAAALTIAGLGLIATNLLLPNPMAFLPFLGGITGASLTIALLLHTAWTWNLTPRRGGDPQRRGQQPRWEPPSKEELERLNKETQDQ